MEHRPPPLDNGYVWVAHILIRQEPLRELEAALAGGIRHVMNRRGLEGHWPPFSDEIELWVHPDDRRRLGPALRQALDDSGPDPGVSTPP